MAMLTLVLASVPGAWAQAPNALSAYVTDAVVQSDGSNEADTPPQATFTAYLNRNPRRILIENAPTWVERTANITGQGRLGLQAGNFPALEEGDSLFIRYTDRADGEQGVLAVHLAALPYDDYDPTGPFTPFRLKARTLPPRPADLHVKEREGGARVVTWAAIDSLTYHVYRSSRGDTLPDGTPRNVYRRVASGLHAAQYVDAGAQPDSSYQYVVYARSSEGVWSAHSYLLKEKAPFLSSVPRPVVPARPDLVAMYDTAWKLGRENTERGTPQNGFVDRYIDASFDNRIFQWDTAFSLAWAKYAQGTLPNIESLDNFYRKQHEDGAIAGVIHKSDGSDSPDKSSPYFTRNNLFSWAEWEYYQTTGDSSRFDRVIPILDDYADWVRRNRRHENGHYWWSGFGSGMDNSPRSTATRAYPPYSWVDYDANEALAAYYLAKMAEVAGRADVAQEYHRRHARLKRLVNEDMWSEEDQFYWDLDRDGSFLKVKTVASFWPLWARITEPRHVKGLVHALKNKKTFNRPHRVPTLAASHPDYCPEGCYWRGSVWAPTNHMIIQGLMANGRYELAREIVVNHLENMVEVYQETGTVWENYAPETAAPGDPAQADFVGWSADGPIAQLIENYIGIIPDVPNSTIQWNLLTPEEVGMRNLDFGGATITEMRAEARASRSAPRRLIIETPRAFTLEVYDGVQTRTLNVAAGRQTFTVTPTAAREQPQTLPKLRLHASRPEPFREHTVIPYDLPRGSIVRLVIYDVLGRRVATLRQGRQSAGKHEVTVTARQLPAAGAYFYRLETSDGVKTGQMTVLR